MAAQPVFPQDDGERLSLWVTVTQAMIDQFGTATLDRDPIHVDIAWAKKHSPFGGTIAFGFLTMSLLTHLLHDALGSGFGEDPASAGSYLNYGFNRLRLMSPVKEGKRVRGRFKVGERRVDERGRWIAAFDCVVEIEDEPKPALVGQWLSLWLPPDQAA